MLQRVVVVICLGVAVTACGGGHKSQPDCAATGTQCTEDMACCTGNCDDLTGLCAREPGECLPSGAGCAAGPDCCSFSCVDFSCSGDQCTSDGDSCCLLYTSPSPRDS